MMRHSKTFLTSIVFVFLIGFSSISFAQSESDSLTVSSWLTTINELKTTKNASFSKLLIEAGRLQVGTKYEAGLLDIPKTEKLVVTTKGADCVLFVENAAAVALAVQDGNPSFANFKNWLQLLRYRNGTITDYASRKHYFTEWMIDLVAAGKMSWVSFEQPKPLQNIHFMSSRTELYQKITSEKMLEDIRKTEAKINAASVMYLPKESLAAEISKLKTGDIIGFVTTVKGLDVSHTGIFMRENGSETFMHASTKGSVMIEPTGLVNYVTGKKNLLGIVVGRMAGS